MTKQKGNIKLLVSIVRTMVIKMSSAAHIAPHIVNMIFALFAVLSFCGNS